MNNYTCNMQHATCNMQHATCNMQHATCNMQHATKRATNLLIFLPIWHLSAALAFIFASSLVIHQSAAAYCPGRFEVLDSGECPTTKVCPDNSQILLTEQCPVLATGATKKCEDGSRVAKIADCPLYKDRNSIFLRESSPIISSLVDGADINIANSYGNTILHMVSGREASSVLVSVLLELGANINARDRDGDLPFHLAAINGNTDIMKMLVARSNNISAYINSPGRRDSTPLHLATEAHQPESIALLLQLGVDITATNNRRMTALQIAQERNYVSLIPLLQSAESTPNSTNPLPAATSSSSNSGKVLGIAAGAAAIAAAWWFFNKDDSDFSWTPSYSFANNNGNMSYSVGSRWTATANDWQIYWQTRQTDKFVYGSGISYNNGILSAAMNSESEGDKTDLDLDLSANKTVGLWDFGGGYNFDMQLSETETDTKNRLNAKVRYTMDKWILSANANTDGDTATARINYSYRF